MLEVQCRLAGRGKLLEAAAFPLWSSSRFSEPQKKEKEGGREKGGKERKALCFWRWERKRNHRENMPGLFVSRWNGISMASRPVKKTSAETYPPRAPRGTTCIYMMHITRRRGFCIARRCEMLNKCVCAYTSFSVLEWNLLQKLNIIRIM